MDFSAFCKRKLNLNIEIVRKKSDYSGVILLMDNIRFSAHGMFFPCMCFRKIPWVIQKWFLAHVDPNSQQSRPWAAVESMICLFLVLGVLLS